jgi:hypothetical protein
MSLWIQGALAIALVAGTAEGGCTEPPPRPGGEPQVALKSLARDPAAYLDKAIAATGTLANEGKNYFTDLRVVLRDDAGNRIAVKPWLPTALPPAPRPGPRPPTLAQYLGKTLDLVATVRHGELRDGTKAYYLEVKEARVRD